MFELPPLADGEADRDIWFALVGLTVGAMTGTDIPALVGIPSDAREDELKALGAASASTGAVALFHAVGVTPEARRCKQRSVDGQPTAPSRSRRPTLRVRVVT